MAIVIYFLGCVLVGLMGSRRTIGFWGFFIMSVFLTPLIPAVFLLVTGQRRFPQA